MPENASCSSASSCSKESCEGCPSKKDPKSFIEEMNAYSNIKHVIGIDSAFSSLRKRSLAPLDKRAYK